MSFHQQFRLGDEFECLAVCQDDDGTPYCQLNDIQETFPNAARFKLNGVTLNFLEDKNKKKASHTLNPTAVLSTIASDITHIQYQLDHSADKQSAYHQQLLEQLVRLLQEQAEAKERDNRILAELAAAKERDEETLRLQQMAIDKLVVAQQRIEAILVQNYELHEYTIPRLFVILPDSYETWDPRTLFRQKFRLYFLCECGEECGFGTNRSTASSQLTITAPDSLAVPLPVSNSLHLAKHEGYELSRPTDFFDRYGPYVLGMLRILRHCLAVVSVVAPAMMVAQSGVKEIMEGVESLSERTLAAVDISINFLEAKLDGDAMGEGVAEGKDDAGDDDEEDVFKNLAALEGADLRRLDSFLRNKDADKVLGNLYRITTETGHVKWVCLDHYRQVYRDTTMASFLQSIETSGGTYDPQRGNITVELKSSTAARDFFSRLSQQGQAIHGLKVTLSWSFSAADLVMLVEKIAQSNIREFKLCIEGQGLLDPLVLLMRPGKGKYYSILSLFSNPKIKSLTFSEIDLLGLSTLTLGTSHRPSLLRSFRYAGKIFSIDSDHLADIIAHCPHLVELKLGSFTSNSEGVHRVDQVIGSLSKLETLHRYRLYKEALSVRDIKSSTAPYGSGALRELVEHGMHYRVGYSGFLETAIRRSSATLEVLMLHSHDRNQILHLPVKSRFSYSPTSPTIPDRLVFSNLSHLELFVDMTQESLNVIATALPDLALVHLGVGDCTSVLLRHTNLSTLKSLSLNRTAEHYYHQVVESANCQIESLMLVAVPWSQSLSNFLSATPLKRLFLDHMDVYSLDKILAQVNLSQLQVLTICNHEYQWNNEKVLVARRYEFAEGFLLQLGYGRRESKRDPLKQKSRDAKGSSTRLSSQQVRVVFDFVLLEEHYAAILPPTSQW
ncbi:hypothetical protein BGX24_000933 [Mortierella sp. AD032]|nr:hypothetical protein BGX24_000933 [Mortierella sp. AD032]